MVQDEAGHGLYVDRYGRPTLKLPGGPIKLGSFAGDLEAFHGGLAAFGVPAPGEEGFGAELHYGYVTRSGRVVVPPTYRGAGPFSEGLAPVSKDASYQDDPDPMYAASPEGGEAWGYIDGAGKVVIPFGFSRAGIFVNGLARARQSGKWGYIDRTGAWAIRPRFDWAWDFDDGIAKVWRNDRVSFIDRSGRVIVETNVRAVTY